MLEVCTDSVRGAAEAERGGAQRIELCSALVEGGVTPSAGLIEQVLLSVAIPVHILIRPRGGDFCYDEDEMRVMLADIKMAKSLGAHGVVVGCLTAEGDVDSVRTGRLVDAARPMSVTFHRAIDMARDWRAALRDCAALGVHRVLTSGQASAAWEGRDVLRAMKAEARGALIIVAGGGVTEDNVAELMEYTGILEVHGSARTARDGEMRFRPLERSIFMGSEKRNGPDTEFSVKVADAHRVRQLAAAAQRHAGCTYTLPAL